MIAPAEPSTVMESPSRSSTSPSRATPAAASIAKASTPTTAGMPHPRAITAAWLAMPPVAVMMAAAADMATSSAGVVNGRTNTAGMPSSSASNTASAVRHTRPDAAPGEAATP